MKGKSHKNIGIRFLKRVMSAMLVAVMLFTMVGIYIPAETFKAASSNYATVVGNFDALSSYNSNVTANWTPADTNGKMDYLGAKNHYKLITFDALTSAVNLEFKVAFNGTWDWSIGKDGGSDNITITLPTGTTQLKVFTDESNVYYSIGDDTTVDEKLAVAYAKVTGSFSSLSNCNISSTWSESEPTGQMEYLGNGYYYKLVKFDETSGADVEYKITLNNSWDYQISDGGSNIKVTVPSGASEFVIIADVNTDTAYNSIAHPDKVNEILGGESEDATYNYTIYVQDDWDAEKSVIHAWNSGESGTNLTLSEVEETFNGTKWLKAEFEGKSSIGFLLKNAGDDWAWQTADVTHVNTTRADQTLYYANGTLYTNIDDVPDFSEGNYVFVEYAGEPSAGKNVYTWANGYSESGFFVPFKETADGTYIAKIPIKLDGENDRKFGFLVNSAPRWDNSTKEGGDLFYTLDADKGYAKIVFSGGSIVKDLTDVKSSMIHRKDGIITFNYRDNDIFASEGIGYLGEDVEVKVHVIEKTDTAQSEVAAYVMTYDKSTSAYTYDLTLQDDTDYYYYYTVDGVEAADANTTRTAELDDKTYSYNRNKVYRVAVEADVCNDSMDYDENNVISITYGPETEKDSLDGFNLEHVYLDLTELGLGNKVEVNKDLMEFSFGCSDDVEAGEKTIKVTLLDDCDMEYYAEVKVTVTERVKGDDFDWDEAVIYFAVTDRFYDGNSENNTVTDDGEATTGYNKENTLGIHGGDFAGLTEKLDYLQELGVNTIWITPIVDNIDEAVDGDNNSYGYHGYWSEDFTTLNPHLGTADEFKTLIDEAHARDMKIMVDVVLNHAGYETEEVFNNTLDTGYVDGSGNPVYKDMIRADEDVVADDNEKMELSGLPDFVTEDPEVRALLIAWQTQWMKGVEAGGFDIDYYRVDTVKHVDETTWTAFKNELTKINSRFKIIGEYYDAGCLNDYDQIGTGKMDSILDFHFNDILSALVDENLTYIENALQERNALLGNTATMGSFLSSHDENGFLYDLASKEGDTWAEALMKVAATYQITAKGQPVIYYGEEIGLTGANNYPEQDNRYDFNWTLATDSNPMYVHYKKMLNIRADYSEIFAKGERYGVVIPNVQNKDGSEVLQGYEVFARSYEGETIYVGTNVWGDAKDVTFYVNGGVGSVYTDLYNGGTYTVSSAGTITVSIPGAANGGTVVLAKTAGDPVEVEDNNEVTVKIHYNRTDNNYTDWNAWLWSDNAGGKQYDFVEENGDMVATITVDGRNTTTVNFRIRLGEWKANDHDAKDQSIDISDIVSGTVHYYVESGVWGGTMMLGSDAIVGNKIVDSEYDRITNTFKITTTRPISGSFQDAFAIKCTTSNTDITITDVTANGCVYTVTIDEDLTAMKDVLKAYSVTFDGFEYNLVMPNIYSTKEFEDAYTYDGDDLGLTYSEEESLFKVWAPTADKVVLNVYESGTKGTEDLIESYEMTAGEKGVWSYTLEGDWNGKYYTYSVSVNNETNEVCDPYARTTGVNGNRAMILDLDSTDPEGWNEDTGAHTGMSYTDAIIYELHVRDLSSNDSSGVSEENQGKFLGLTETGTKTEEGTSTALDHMIDLGVTHVHLLPIYDYASVDESRLDEPQFNWGYDPLNYNVPEGSYSTDPYDGATRVNEMKQMVMALHENNINVIMDVVYNHVYDAGTFGFNQIVPSYFSRTNADGTYSNGSGCGNDTATERSMVHKYVVESILYWHEEYHIDGFRFDLVGLLDTVTINKIVEEVHKIDPDIIFYGEGWTLGTAVSKDGYYMATQQNAYLTPGFAYFSDTIRNGVAGSDTDGQGYIWVSGKEDLMKQCFTATTSWCPEPTQTINYVSCHDNYTLMDKINEVSNAPYDSYDDAPGEYQVRLNNLAASFYMLSEGIPLIHAGEEFLRTKLDEDGTVIHNSYNASDYVNTLRWYNLDESELYADTVDYYEGLIEFRKNHEALRLTTSEEVAANVTYKWVTNDVILFLINGKASIPGEASDGIVIIYNASSSDQNINLYNYGAASGTWNVCIDEEDAGVEVLDTITNGQVTVASKSAMALVMGDTVDTDSVYLDNNKVTITMDETLALKEGATAVLTATVNPANSTLIWTSSDETVATVDEEGNVTAVGIGTATITVSTLHGVTATCTVTVEEKEEDPVDPPVDPEDPPVDPEDPPVDPEDPPVDSEDPEEPEKEDVVYVPEDKVENQVKDEADKLTDKIENNESLEGVVSEETLNKVQDAIANNEGIITELVIENMEAVEVEEDAKNLVEAALENLVESTKSVVAQYLDIKVVLKTEESGEELGTLNKLSEEITLTFEIPEEWKIEGRTFSVIRVHDGKTDVLDVWENEDGTLSFKTDRFSTYALIYTDGAGAGNPTPIPPATGDNNMGVVYFFLLLTGCAAAMVGIANAKRKSVK